ncbi:MAG: response regulator [Deltaproteobacteria bacterium]|nr:response regulator [Deltaproteobacteria bacterium]
MNISVIDDETFILRLMKKTLERDGYVVRVYRSGELFLNDIENFRPDLVFLDILMPGLNGIQVYERLSELIPQQKVIFISAYDFTGKLDVILKRSYVWYLPKPFGIKELREIISQTGHIPLRAKRCQSTEFIGITEEEPKES